MGEIRRREAYSYSLDEYFFIMAQKARFDFGILLLKIVASEKNKEERL